MKRLIALALTLLLCAMPALAELWYTDDVLPDGSPIYYFEELSLTLPASWAGKVMAMEGEYGTAFYQKASYEKYSEAGIEGGGFLFSLGASVNSSFSELPSYIYLGFSEESAMNYYLELPSDYPAWMEDEGIRAEYDAMFADIDAVAQSASFYNWNDALDGGTTGPNDAAEAEAVEEAEEAAAAEEEVVEEAAEEGAVAVEDIAGEAAADAAAASGATLAQLRYHFEHNAMPRYFFDDPANMIDTLERVGAFALFSALGDENGVAYPYTAEDFAERSYVNGDGVRLLQLVMPRPEQPPQCFRIYMIYDPATQAAAYYTVEYENLLDETALLCAWEADGTHDDYGAIQMPAEKGADGYEDSLFAEAQALAEFAGISTDLAAGAEARVDEPAPTGLALVECPEQGFTTQADPAYSTEYEEGTGLYIYTEEAGRIPYVIVYRSEDLLAEPYDFVVEQFTPHVQAQYGDDLVDYLEFESFEIGGKQLPGGVYTYRLQGHVIDMLRLFDSTGDTTVSFSAKYEHDNGGDTLAALDAAIRGYKAE